MSYFHIDGFVFWLIVGEFFAMLLKALFHRVRRWALHVQYMTKLAGGSLAVDVEAKYWNDKIHDPMYRSIWRWYYGNIWNKKHPGGTQAVQRKKRRLMKLLALASAVLLICIALVSVFGLPNVVPEPIPVTTSLVVHGTFNLTAVSSSIYDVNNTMRADGNFSGDTVGLALGIIRTDKSNSDATIFLNVTSETFTDANGTAVPYVQEAIYLVYSPSDGQYYANDVFGTTEFGMIFNVPAHSEARFLLYFIMPAFNSTNYARYVTISAFGDPLNTVGIDGGFYKSSYPCYMALSAEMYPRLGGDTMVVAARC